MTSHKPTQWRSFACRISCIALSSLLLLPWLTGCNQGGQGNAIDATPINYSEAGKLCIDCHKEITPNIVTDWELSAHSRSKDKPVDCSTCHGTGHTSKDDVNKLKTVTADTCKECHETQYTQFKAGKHSIAWAALKAMPTTHMKPMELIDGMKGCGGCHKLGLKDDAEIERLKKTGSGFGFASCDACHTRHTFSVKEAKDPLACATCHMGFDHPQWEMYSTSKHGIRHTLKKQGDLPESAAAPTCQTCHMSEGNHEVRTAWGFLAVRVGDGLTPYPGEDEEWWADRVTILQALGVLDPDGKPTARLDVVIGADVARVTTAAFDKERDKMLKICSQCHSDNFAKGELEKGDRMIKAVDHLLAKAILIIADLYKDGLLEKPDSYAYPFPDLLTFHDAPTVIETTLFKMHLKHRMRAFQGTFHANPDYALWYGWNEMQLDLRHIEEIAAEIREKAAKEASAEVAAEPVAATEEPAVEPAPAEKAAPTEAPVTEPAAEAGEEAASTEE